MGQAGCPLPGGPSVRPSVGVAVATGKHPRSAGLGQAPAGKAPPRPPPSISPPAPVPLAAFLSTSENLNRSRKDGEKPELSERKLSATPNRCVSISADRQRCVCCRCQVRESRGSPQGHRQGPAGCRTLTPGWPQPQPRRVPLAWAGAARPDGAGTAGARRQTLGTAGQNNTGTAGEAPTPHPDAEHRAGPRASKHGCGSEPDNPRVKHRAGRCTGDLSTSKYRTPTPDFGQRTTEPPSSTPASPISAPAAPRRALPWLRRVSARRLRLRRRWLARRLPLCRCRGRGCAAPRCPFSSVENSGL